MAESQLEQLAEAFVLSAARRCREDPGHEILKDQLLYAAAQIENHIREAGFLQGQPEAVSELKNAERACREADYWLSLLVRSGIWDKESISSLDMNGRKLKRMLGTSRRAREVRLADRAGKHKPQIAVWPTSRLLLRSWNGRFSMSLLTLLSEEEKQLLSFSYANREEALALIRSWQEKDEMLAVIRQRDDRVIGLVGLLQDGANPQSRRLLFAIAKEMRCCGYATEAVRGALDYGFRKLGMTVAVARTRQEEAVARRLLTHCGFLTDGILRAASMHGDNWVYQSLLKEEWSEYTSR